MLSLKQKLALRLTALLVATASIGVFSAWGFVSLRDRYAQSEEQYELLRHVYELSHHADSGRMLLADNPDQAAQRIRSAAALANKLLTGNTLDPVQRKTLSDIAANLVEIDATQRGVATGKLVATLQDTIKLSNVINQQILDNRVALSAQLEQTLQNVLILVLVVIVIATFISLAQYISVARPLRRLGEGVRQLSAARFSEPIEPTGDREFVELAERFNQVSKELGELYASLEDRIQTQSRDLVRSEQMAGVGYLAAGVAHEINNPLGIISGYAEEAKDLIDQNESGNNSEEIKRSLTVICEEAFRCKGIIQQLLNLASPGQSERGPVDVADILEQIVEVLRGLKIFKDQGLRLHFNEQANLTVLGSAAELKQVILNLLTNALEAVDAEGGEVDVHIRSEADQVIVEVKDNGSGMSQEIADKVFEPFFTKAKTTGGKRGTGLGLSISLSIVEEHGGTLRAASAGLGQGSTFTVSLPISGDSDH